MSLWDALRMNMMISYQELVRTFLSKLTARPATPNHIKCGVCGIYAYNSQELS
jgi:hypothetical protein